jgi:TolA-binding protein
MTTGRVWCLSVSLALVLSGPLPSARAQSGNADEFARRQYDSGLEFMRAGKLTEALKDFQAVVDNYPATSVADDAMLAIARYQLDVARDPAAAQATAEALVKKFPASDSVPMGYVIAGQAMVARGLTPANVDAALANLERVPRLFPGTDAVAPAVYAHGDTLRRLGRCTEALERFDQVTMEYPRTTWASLAHLSRAACLVSANRVVDAMQALGLVTAQFPSSPQAAIARRWNTILYRLYVRPPAQPAYVFANKVIAGPSGKLRDITGIGIDPDNAVLVGTRTGVLVLDEKGAAIRSVGSGEVRGFVVDDHGKVVLIQKALMQQEGAVAPAAVLTLTVPRDGGQARVLDDMAAVAILSNGDRLVADRAQRAVFRFDAAGKFLGPFATARASRLAVGPGDQVAWLDRDAKSVSVLDRTGKPGVRLAAKGTGYDLTNPTDVAFDELGHLYVLDRSAVVVFAPDGRFVTSFAAAPASPGAFRDADALALDGAGRLFIYDNRNERVQVYQ